MHQHGTSAACGLAALPALRPSETLYTGRASYSIAAKEQIEARALAEAGVRQQSEPAA